MKTKLLLLMLISSYGIYSQSIGLKGPDIVYLNEPTSYTIIYGGLLNDYVMGTISVVEGHSNRDSFAIPKGADIFNFRVTFTNETENASITVRDNRGGKAVISGIKVIKRNNPDKDILVGPNSLYVTQSADYVIQEYNNQYVWWYNTNCILTEYGTKETVQKSKVAVTAIAPSPDDNGIAYIYGALFKHHPDISSYTEKLINKKIQIIPAQLTRNLSNNVICSSQLITYTLKDYYPSAKITWQAISNASLISGQGTPNAVFRINTGGKVAIKAIISANNINYVLEDSEIWAGKPIVNDIGGQLGYGNDANHSSLYTLIADANPKNSSTQYAWSVSPSLSDPVTASITPTAYNMSTHAALRTQYVANNKIVKNTVTVNVKNQCGVTTYKESLNILGNRTGGGGIGPIGPGDPGPLNLKLKSQNFPSAVSVNIYDFNNGKLVYQNKEAINFNIQDTNLKDGFYIVEITDASGNKTANKVYKRNQ